MNGKHVFFIVSALVWLAFPAWAQQQDDSKKNQLSVGIQFMGHGEYQGGGLPRSDTDGQQVADRAGFLLSRLRLNVGYQRPGIEALAVIQNFAVWGMASNMSLDLYEGWVKLSSKGGLFAQVGRVALSYDDERIIGLNDFAMAAMSHDVLRAGYEGHGHKVHGIFAYNQNASNVFTNTYYTGGAQYYKTMQTLWYHYDVPKFPLGISLLAMNVGLQAGLPDDVYNQPRVVYQQMLGTYLKYASSFLTAEVSYYRQLGSVVNVYMQDGKINAWMASGKVSLKPFEKLGFDLGYDYLSGDDYVPVLYGGSPIGLPKHAVLKGFTPLFGSRTKFYGLLDYFYQSAQVHGFSPGLQNACVGVNWNPFKDFTASAAYHYLAVGTRLEGLDMTLGHDVDFTLAYQFSKYVSLTLSYTFMSGTETMNRLKQNPKTSLAHWAWFSLMVSPEIFRARW